MRNFLIGIGAVAILGLIFWYLMIITAVPTQNSQPTNNGSTTGGSILPPSATAPASTGAIQPIPDQQASAGTQPEIAKEFLGQIQNSDLITLKGTAVVSTYALQIWGDENKGGEALLKYDSATKEWTLMHMGGGLWSAEALVAVGVPQSVAEKLVIGLQLQ